MKVAKPNKTAITPDGSSQFEFNIEDFPNRDKDGQFYVRGSVCWPVLNEATGVSEGHIICAAQRVDTGTVIIFEDTPFRCVDHILGADGRIEIMGLSSWFNAVWAKYTANLFFRSGNDETHRVYLLQVLRSVNIKPSPGFPEVFICDMDDAINVLYNWRTKKKIVMDTTSKLHEDLLMWENTGRKLKMASVQAFITLINGYEKYPFRKTIMQGE